MGIYMASSTFLSQLDFLVSHLTICNPRHPILRPYKWYPEPYRIKLCRPKLFVGRNFRHQTKNSSLSIDEKFRPIKVKVSLNEVQVNLREKQVI